MAGHESPAPDYGQPASQAIPVGGRRARQIRAGGGMAEWAETGLTASASAHRLPINQTKMKTSSRIFAAVAAALLTCSTAFAGDPTGAWKWTTQGRGGETREVSAKFVLQADGVLSGTVLGWQGQENPISQATFKDETLAFSVVVEFNGNKRETKYQGKLEADTITGTIERQGRDGQTTKSEWKAVRQK
jgi:hypothetical protein